MLRNLYRQECTETTHVQACWGETICLQTLQCTIQGTAQLATTHHTSTRTPGPHGCSGRAVTCNTTSTATSTRTTTNTATTTATATRATDNLTFGNDYSSRYHPAGHIHHTTAAAATATIGPSADPNVICRPRSACQSSPSCHQLPESHCACTDL